MKHAFFVLFPQVYIKSSRRKKPQHKYGTGDWQWKKRKTINNIKELSSIELLSFYTRKKELCNTISYMSELRVLEDGPQNFPACVRTQSFCRCACEPNFLANSKQLKSRLASLACIFPDSVMVTKCFGLFRLRASIIYLTSFVFQIQMQSQINIHHYEKKTFSHAVPQTLITNAERKGKV